jgi:hypothetical protein
MAERVASRSEMIQHESIAGAIRSLHAAAPRVYGNGFSGGTFLMATHIPETFCASCRELRNRLAAYVVAGACLGKRPSSLRWGPRFSTSCRRSTKSEKVSIALKTTSEDDRRPLRPILQHGRGQKSGRRGWQNKTRGRGSIPFRLFASSVATCDRSASTSLTVCPDELKNTRSATELYADLFAV